MSKKLNLGCGKDIKPAFRDFSKILKKKIIFGKRYQYGIG